MPNRILRDGILSSERVNQIANNPATEVFYRRLHSVADDYGRYSGDPRILRVACYPLMLDSVCDADVLHWLDECATAGLLVLYKVDRKPYLEIVDFKQTLRIKRSKYPAPAEQTHDTCTASAPHMHNICVPESESESESEKTPAAETAAVYDLVAETFGLSDEDGQTALNQEPVPKHALLNPEVETVLDQVAHTIHDRHPLMRRCGMAEVKRQLRAIARKAPVPQRIELLHQIDRNHAAWCVWPEWRKDAGQYAKGLNNWLAPTKERWKEPPPESPPERSSDELNEYGHPRLMM
jgi:hypothetical protein